MITINIRTSLVFSEDFGHWKFQISLLDNSSFGDLLEQVEKTYGQKAAAPFFEPDGKTPASHIMFMVNGRNIRFLDGKKTILQDNDDVTMLLPAGGG